jgi:hypothetical protein
MPQHVSSVTCSFSGGAKQAERGVLRNIPSATCVAPTEDEQIMFETCRNT